MFTYIIKCSFVFVLFVCCHTIKTSAQELPDLNAKQIASYCEKQYSANEIIQNGKIYFSPYRNSIGTPFYKNTLFQNCTLFKLGKSYSKQAVFLDIFKQQLILEVLNSLGGKEQLIIPTGSIDSMHMNNSTYVFNHELKVFLKVIAQAGNHQFLLLQNKKQRISQSESKQEFYPGANRIFYNGKKGFHSLKHKHDLIHMVDPVHQKSFKKYMGTLHFSLKRIDVLKFKKVMTKFALLQ